MGPQDKPTVAEAAWLRAITAFGCVACYLDGYPGMPAAVHHIVDGNRRLGHRFTLPLCDPGHHQNGRARGLISLHPGKSRTFIKAYGTELSLLARLERKLGFPPARRLARVGEPMHADGTAADPEKFGVVWFDARRKP